MLGLQHGLQINQVIGVMAVSWAPRNGLAVATTLLLDGVVMQANGSASVVDGHTQHTLAMSIPSRHLYEVEAMYRSPILMATGL